jgi:OFA family oxalate/formate antiporter-like MFS transporter
VNKRLVLFACFLTVFVAYAVRYGYGILLPDMLNSLGITKTDAGIIFSSFLIAYTIGSPICGYISDRYGSRWMLSTFVVAMGLGAFLMSRVTTILQASLFFALAGLGAAACWAPVVALAQKWTSHKRRGMTIAFIDIGSALSIVAMASFVPFIVNKYDWQTGWMILGIVTVAAGVMNFLVIKNPPGVVPPAEDNKPARTKTDGGSLRDWLHSRKFWLFALGYLFTGVVVTVPFTFLTTYAVQELSYSHAIAANVMTLLGIGAIASKLIIGPLSDKTGRLKMMLFCGLFLGLGALGMSFHHIATLFIATFIFSMGYGAVWAMYAAAASDYFDRASSGTIVGIWTIFLGIGLAAAPIISGWLADATGTLTWSFVLGGAGGILSVILLIPLWKKDRVQVNSSGV